MCLEYNKLKKLTAWVNIEKKIVVDQMDNSKDGLKTLKQIKS